MEGKFISITIKLIGLVIMGLSIVHAFGVYEFPSAGLDKPLEVLIAFLLGGALFLIPATVLEKKLEKKIDDLSDPK